MAENLLVTMEEDSNDSFDEAMSDDGLDNLIVLDSSSMEDEEEEKVVTPPAKKQKKDPPEAKKEVAKPKAENEKSRHRSTKSSDSSKKSSSRNSVSRKSEHDDRRRKPESRYNDRSKKPPTRSEYKDRWRRPKPEIRDRKRNNIPYVQETAKERKQARNVECAREIRQYGRYEQNKFSSDKKAEDNEIIHFKKPKLELMPLSVRSIAIQCNMPSKPATATEILDYCLFASRNRWSRQMQVKTTAPEHYIHTVLAAHPIRDVSAPLETYLEEWCQFGPSQEPAEFFKSQGTADYPFFPAYQFGSYNYDNSVISSEFTYEIPNDNSVIPSETVYETANDSSIISSETPNDDSVIPSETTSETPNDESMISS